jgi:hypothetical protein
VSARAATVVSLQTGSECDDRFIRNFRYEFSGKPALWESPWYTRTDRPTEDINLIMASRKQNNLIIGKV